MGASGARNGGGRDTSANNVPPSRRRFQPVTGTLSDPREKDDTAAKLNLFYNDPYSKKQGGPLVLKPFEPLFDAGAKKTREFFTDKVLTSEKGMKNLGYTKDEFSALSRTKQEEVYKGYMSNRQSGATDAYGNPMRGGNNNKPSMIKKNIGGKIVSVAPTKAEVSQSEAVNATSEEDSIYLRKKKTKAKGRSQTILTSSRGVTTDEGLTLGKKSLLGS